MPEMSAFWHKIGCCVVAKPPPKKKRRRIDRSMIGEPTNFVHLTHIGSGEMADGMQPTSPDPPYSMTQLHLSEGQHCLFVCWATGTNSASSCKLWMKRIFLLNFSLQERKKWSD
uniref:CDC42 small effector 1 n=1 Tax=Cyprinus carpio carpio TaxID=630221 RepID=A0A8C0YJ51_CYPCA